MTAEPAQPEARGLVFARIGGRSLHPTWLTQPAKERGWDVQFSTFDPSLAIDSGDFPLSLDTGTKWDSIARFLRAKPETLDRYDYILFPDDDLLFDPGSFDRIFETCREQGLLIAQPALTPSSFFSHPLLLACPNFRLRFSSIIEPMCPCIRTSYLRDILWCFERWITGWGQDMIWTHLMEDPRDRAAILDEIRMTHTRPLQTGQIYDHFKKLGIDFEREMQDIRTTFETVPTTMTVYGGILHDGRRLGRVLTQVLNGLHLVRSSSASRYPQAVMRAGKVLLVRSLTMFGYRPTQIKQRATSHARTQADTGFKTADAR